MAIFETSCNAALTRSQNKSTPRHFRRGNKWENSLVLSRLLWGLFPPKWQKISLVKVHGLARRTHASPTEVDAKDVKFQIVVLYLLTVTMAHCCSMPWYHTRHLDAWFVIFIFVTDVIWKSEMSPKGNWFGAEVKSTDYDDKI